MFICKNTIYLSLIFCSCYFYSFSQTKPDSVGSNFLPLHLGNQWQFITLNGAITGSYYTLSTIKINQESIIQNRHYFYWDDKWIRYCDSTAMIYVWWNDSDRVYMDFNLPEGAQFLQFVDSSYRTVTIKEDTITNFIGRTFISKGFNYLYDYQGFQKWDYKRFGEELGFYYSNEGYYIVNWIYSGRANSLIMAILYDSTGMPVFITGHNKPEFTITPITTINSSNFYLDFRIDHVFSRYDYLIQPPNRLNFVDSVLMYRYYSNGDSIINLPTIIPFSLYNYPNPFYYVHFDLDTLLIKNGYNFYYRFYASDKGIIQEHSWSPDSGYYECVWDFPDQVSEIENNVLYYLDQNFPNPFNPNTTIEYSIAEAGLVEVEIMDLLGRRIKTIVNEFQNKGKHQVKFDASEFSSGIYFYRIRSGEFVQVKKMLLLK